MEGGIRLKTGEVVPLDIIIFGTGYSVLNSVVPSMGLCNRLSGASQEASELLNVKGSEGQMVAITSKNRVELLRIWEVRCRASRTCIYFSVGVRSTGAYTEIFGPEVLFRA